MTPREYVVMDGDDLVTIAARFGFADTSAIRSLPENAALLGSRSGGAQLFHGDVVYVPPVARKFVALRAEATTTFTLRRPRYPLTFVVRGHDGTPSPGIPYRLSADGVTLAEGITGDDGVLRCEVPVRHRALDLVIAGMHQRVRVGALNPLLGAPDGGASGAAQRLGALGYGPLGRAPSGDDELRRAIRAFKAAQGLPEPDRAELDEALFNALTRAYGQ